MAIPVQFNHVGVIFDNFDVNDPQLSGSKTSPLPGVGHSMEEADDEEKDNKEVRDDEEKDDEEGKDDMEEMQGEKTQIRAPQWPLQKGSLPFRSFYWIEDRGKLSANCAKRPCSIQGHRHPTCDAT